jgi:hypothetical protein
LLLLLLDLRLIGRFVDYRIEPNNVVLAVALGLLGQTQIGLRQPLVFGSSKWVFFRPCEGGYRQP